MMTTKVLLALFLVVAVLSVTGKTSVSLFFILYIPNSIAPGASSWESDCKDHVEVCGKFARHGMCDMDGWLNWMGENCPKSCGVCSDYEYGPW